MRDDDNVVMVIAGLWFIFSIVVVAMAAHRWFDANWWATTVISFLWTVGLGFCVSAMEP